MTWWDTAGNTPPHEPRQHVQAHSIEEPEPAEPADTKDDEYRCEWCFAYLPADGLCRCPSSLHDLEQARLEQKYEMEKER